MLSNTRHSTLIIGFGKLGQSALSTWPRLKFFAISRTAPVLKNNTALTFIHEEISEKRLLSQNEHLGKIVKSCSWINFWLPFSESKMNENHYLQILADILDLMHKDQLFTFTSSTSIFEQNELIFEDTKPATSSPLYRLEEFIRQRHPFHHIIRLAGLIGPNRHPITSLSGKKFLKGGQTPVNLVHEIDATNFLYHLYKHRHWGKRSLITNLCSHTHLTKEVFYSNAAKYRGLPMPNFDDQDNESKKFRIVDNSHLWLRYNFQLKHLHVH